MHNEMTKAPASDGKPAPDATDGQMVRHSQSMGEWGIGGLGHQTTITSLDMTTLRGRELAMKAVVVSFPKFDDILNTTVEIQDWLCSPVEFTNEETGEMVKAPLTRIFLANGDCYQTTGPAVIKALVAFHEMIRPAPWIPPQAFSVRRIATKPPKSYWALLPVFDAAPPATKGKSGK